MRKVYFFLFSFFFLIASIYFVKPSLTGNAISSDYVIATLEKGITQAKAEGVYECCIEPACTMCYLGHWKFEKGTCYCDKAIREGKTEDVCPECKKAQDIGQCESSSGDCVLNEEIYG